MTESPPQCSQCLNTLIVIFCLPVSFSMFKYVDCVRIQGIHSHVLMALIVYVCYQASDSVCCFPV